ncbi:MAG: GlmU family protein [Bacteroidales bacterium]|jgi:UDP-N-acetylglucosamine diphosphorylase/glucosamine-1-phosphate N-acetyltransferase|nr:GlmU family protein [Bacteroidales bacterium]
MSCILYDDSIVRTNLLPFTFTRPVCEIRVGVLTIREKWERITGVKTYTLTEDYLQEKFPFSEDADSNIIINSSFLPDGKMAAAVMALELNEALVKGESVIAYRSEKPAIEATTENSVANTEELKEIQYEDEAIQITNVWDIFLQNGDQIRNDFSLMAQGKVSEKLSDSNRIVNPENIFVEHGAKIENAILNAKDGPIYIGRNAEILDGAIIIGPVAICENAIVRMGARVYNDTTVGPFCKVGGEIQNTVFIGYSNKAHDGYLGNSVIGEWCNIGAGTNSSNLKNDYSNVRIWNYGAETFLETGQMFCGLFMGDHSKAAINTSFNTGTIVGVCSNVFGAGFPRQYVPSFMWGGTHVHPLLRAIDTAEKVMARRDVIMDEKEKNILKYVFESTHGNRKMTLNNPK